MAKEHVTRDEAILLDKMVDEMRTIREIKESRSLNENMNEFTRAGDNIMLLLDCIVDFREPPKSLAVEDGHGAMVKGEK